MYKKPTFETFVDTLRETNIKMNGRYLGCFEHQWRPTAKQVDIVIKIAKAAYMQGVLEAEGKR